MTLLTLAQRNLKRQARSYAAFFLSSSFAVWLFFLYTAMMFHPDISGDRSLRDARTVTLTVAVVTGVFSVLFINQAHGAFLKARKKELGLLTMLGLLPGQIARMVHYENLLIGLGAITLGIGAGAACFRLFLLAIGRALALDAPLRFVLSGRAVGVTVIMFALVFGLVSVISHWRLRRVSVAELIRGSAKPKAAPRFSWWLVGLGVLALGGAYGFGLTATERELGEKFPLIVLGILVGSYLLFAQVSVAVLSALRQNRSFYWRPANLFVVSQMFYKIRDNTGVLFMVSGMIAFVLAIVGTSFSMLSVAGEMAERAHPAGIRWTGSPGGITPERVEQVLREYGVRAVDGGHLPVLRAAHSWGVGVFIAKAGDMNRWLERNGLTPLAVPDDALINLQPPVPVSGPARVSLVIGGQAMDLPVARDAWVPHLGGAAGFIAGDELFARLSARDGDGVTELHVYRLDDWRKSGPAIVKLARETGATEKYGPFYGTYVSYVNQSRHLRMMFFLFSFVGVLFFLAAGNMLYFKLFTDLREDRLQFEALYKVGVGQPEVRRIVGTQTFVLFFLPLLVAVGHASVVVAGLSSSFDTNVWGAMGTVILAYAALQAGYYLVTTRTYVRSLLDPRL